MRVITESPKTRPVTVELQPEELLVLWRLYERGNRATLLPKESKHGLNTDNVYLSSCLEEAAIAAGLMHQ